VDRCLRETVRRSWVVMTLSRRLRGRNDVLSDWRRQGGAGFGFLAAALEDITGAAVKWPSRGSRRPLCDAATLTSPHLSSTRPAAGGTGVAWGRRRARR
jgi:hypothetical protein